MSVEISQSQRSRLSEESIRRLRAHLQGRVVLPTDVEYDTARRVANWMIDRRPELIVRCAGQEDVIRAIEFARTHNLVVAVRGGGHSFAGKSTCDGGMVIDLSPLKRVHVNPTRCTAIAEAGLTLGDFDEATQAHGLVTPLGTVPQTGIAGLTLGGGIGWVIGQYGLSCDNLLSVDLVTADGRTLVASANENPDLFWGVRGGGGNFGVVTSFAYRLHPLTQVLGGVLTYPKRDLRRVLRFVREYTSTAPDELTLYAGVRPSGRCARMLCLRMLLWGAGSW